MAEDDIYGNKAVYESFKRNLHYLILHPKERQLKINSRRAGKYYCKNKNNLRYFRKLIALLEAKDLSFIRRLRLLQTLLLVCSNTAKDLAECTREDINTVLAYMHQTFKSPESKSTFIKNLKYVWKQILPELDEKERPDETITPYIVRHISAKIDKSRQKLRKDKLTMDEFEKIVDYFSNDPRMQAYITIAFESLARPQELLFTKIDDVKLHDNYARIYISEHGKEGVGLLQCIDSYPYLLKWLEIHPLKKNKDAFLFINIGNNNRCNQLRPENINKFIKKACRDLNIKKPITCYSLKRNGVTMRRLRGDSDVEIQHAARWTSTERLKTYDLSNQEETFEIALKKRGMLKNKPEKTVSIETKECPFCKNIVGFNETICPNCKHLLDRKSILQEQRKDDEISALKNQLGEIQSQMKNIQEQTMKNLMEKILQMQEEKQSLNSF